ncbi:MAG TPA: TauD/TfdA family dioxygenase [Acidimicrobiales bacterium]
MDLKVTPLTGVIGAELSGVDLRTTLDSSTVDGIRAALDRHLVLFFRDQDITPQQHLALGRRFGTISVAPFGPKHPDHGEITVLDQITPRGEGADVWHTDNTFMLRPPLGSILRAVRLPSVGGDTCFASMYAAYEALSPAMRSMLEPLRATHDLSRMLRKAIANGQAKEDVESMQERWPPVTHPVIRTNPQSGRKSLFINGQWAVFIEGLTERENAVLLPFLSDHVRSPEFQCRFHWEPNSIAFWDNRWVQHYGVADYTERRIMQRVTIEGERPV